MILTHGCLQRKLVSLTRALLCLIKAESRRSVPVVEGEGSSLDGDGDGNDDVDIDGDGSHIENVLQIFIERK